MYTEVEDWVSREKFGAMRYPSIAKTAQGRVSEEICTAAANLAGQLGAKAILVYTHTGASASFVSRRRPDCPILAITGARRTPPRRTSQSCHDQVDLLQVVHGMKPSFGFMPTCFCGCLVSVHIAVRSWRSACM